MFWHSFVLILKDTVLTATLLCGLWLIHALLHDNKHFTAAFVQGFTAVHESVAFANYLLLAGRSMWHLIKGPPHTPSRNEALDSPHEEA